jgi:putative oxygen-independent coproporphyrinogen III oxidase
VNLLPPLSLYVHIPWCVKKCLYCDFNSHPLRSDVSAENYVDALINDIEAHRWQIQDRVIQTIFFGGGTPSVFEPILIGKLINYVRENFVLSIDAEVTLEANPGASDRAKFEGYRKVGVNRLSIGVQTTQDHLLDKLGRVHSGNEAMRALSDAKKIFDNINVDLMFALPGQRIDELKRDLSDVLECVPEHLSIYQLTIEPHTWFYRYPPKLPDDDLASEMQFEIESITNECGYDHYEVSAFAKPDRRCLHNINYWEFGDYVGIGAGAHSKLSGAEGVTRIVKHKQPKRYMDGVASGEAILSSQVIGAESLPFEFFMNALRLNGGVSTDLFEKRTALPVNVVRSRLKALERRGLVTSSDSFIQPTPMGARFLNEVLQEFL